MNLAPFSERDKKAIHAAYADRGWSLHDALRAYRVFVMEGLKDLERWLHSSGARA
jgi:hypothetical protein